MKKIIAVLLSALMLSSFAIAANAATPYLGDTDNSDSAPDAADLAYLKKQLLGIEEDLGLGDINENGETDIIDLVCLKKLLASKTGIVLDKGNTELTDSRD